MAPSRLTLDCRSLLLMVSLATVMRPCMSWSLAGFSCSSRLFTGRNMPSSPLNNCRQHAPIESPVRRRLIPRGLIGLRLSDENAAEYSAPSLSTLSICCLPKDSDQAEVSETGQLGMDLELLSELLMETGALSVVIEDADRGTAEELPIFDEPESKGGSWYRVGSVASGDNFWKRCNVTAYYPFGWDLPRVVGMVAEQFELPVLPRYTVDDVPDEDWVKRVQQDWTPLLVGDLLLRFPWHSEADVTTVRGRSEAGGVREGPELLLEGGMAFGTGEHPTTRLCCQWLQRQIQGKAGGGGVRVLDYGAGSGVLGLAALRFGAAAAVGVEIDKGSILAAESNAAINKLDFRCHLPSLSAADARDDLRYAAQLRSNMDLDSSDSITPLPPSDSGFDLTVANILAGPLVRLAPEIARLTRAGGGLGLSGILSTQAESVVEAYAVFFDHVKVEEQENEWVLVTGVRKE